MVELGEMLGAAIELGGELVCDLLEWQFDRRDEEALEPKHAPVPSSDYHERPIDGPSSS